MKDLVVANQRIRNVTQLDPCVTKIENPVVRDDPTVANGIGVAP